MKKPILKIVVLSLLAATLAEMPLQVCAQDNTTNAPAAKTPKPAKKKTTASATASATQIHGKLTAVDKVAKTITVGDAMYQITSQTKLFKGDKPAILDDGTVGDEVTGTFKKTDDGKSAAATVHFGAAKKETKSAVVGS